MKRMILLLVMLAGVGFSTAAQATLVDRGGGLIYDTDRNITWLQDANYAKTSGYDADGRMTWSQALTWADNLVYGGYDDWRLPSALNPDGSGPNGGYYNVRDSEMGHLFYTELGKTSWSSLGSTTPFYNVVADHYWYSNVYASYPAAAWTFGFDDGAQGAWMKYMDFYAWAIRDGDVAPVPEPGTLLLLGSGLVGLVAMRKRLVGC